MPGMQNLNRLPGCVELGLHVGQLAKRRPILNGISAHHDAAFRKEARTRIPHHVHRLLQIRKPAVDAVLFLPETRRFPRDFVCRIVAGAVDRLPHRGAEIRIECAHNRQWHRADAVVGNHGVVGAAGCVAIDHRYAGRRLPDAAHHGARPHHAAQLFLERCRDPVHPAHRLEHRRLPVDHFLRQHALPQVRVQQRMHRQSIDGLRLFFPRAWRHFETRPLSSLERQIRLQIAILLQERDHALAVFRRNLFVERAFADAFRQQLGNVAARIVHCPAFRHRIPAVQLVALHQRPARRVHFHFERHAQLPAIAEHGVMDRRKPRRARIEIVPLVEAARLAHAAGEVDVGSAADRPVAPAAALARFENRTSIPGFAQFIRRDQAGDARAQI